MDRKRKWTRPILIVNVEDRIAFALALGREQGAEELMAMFDGQYNIDNVNILVAEYKKQLEEIEKDER